MLLRPNDSHKRVAGGIANGLVAGAAPGGTNVYDLDGQAGTLINTSTWDGWIATGRALKSTAINQGAWWPQPGGAIPDGRTWTLAFWVALDSVPSFGYLFNIPYLNDTSTTLALGIQQNATNGYWRIRSTDSGGGARTISDSTWTFDQDGELHLILVTIKASGDVTYYYDGLQKGTTSWSAHDTSFANGADIALLSRNRLSPSEGASARLGAWWLWNRVLAFGEITDLVLDPYLPIREPLDMPLELFATSAAPSTKPFFFHRNVLSRRCG